MWSPLNYPRLPRVYASRTSPPLYLFFLTQDNTRVLQTVRIEQPHTAISPEYASRTLQELSKSKSGIFFKLMTLDDFFFHDSSVIFWTHVRITFGFWKSYSCQFCSGDTGSRAGANGSKLLSAMHQEPLSSPKWKPWPDQELLRNSEHLVSDLDCKSLRRLNRFLNNMIQNREYAEIWSDIILMLTLWVVVSIVKKPVNQKTAERTVMLCHFQQRSTQEAE